MREVLYDATRLIGRTEREAPTGIDRVCLAYAEWLLGLPDIVLKPVRLLKGRLIEIPITAFSAMVSDLRDRWTGMGSSETEHRLVAALNANPPDGPVFRAPGPTEPPRVSRKISLWARSWRKHATAKPTPGQLYLNIGHTGLDNPALLQPLADAGVECVVFLHDLIPLTHPEYCRAGDGDRHKARVLTTLKTAARVIVNSDYTAHELEAFAGANDLTVPPITVAHLGLEPVFLQPVSTSPAPPYFVHVGTLEGRKNLAFLLTLWRRLHDTLGGQTPQLVLVGRYGWENEAVLDHLERSPGLQSLVHHVTDLQDVALARLMMRSRAVLAPSSVEGFDLPAVEASALGVPLIASDIDAHRELVPHARLIDPLDGPGWLRAIETATRERQTVKRQAAPTWPQHFHTVGASLGRSFASHEAVARHKDVALQAERR